MEAAKCRLCGERHYGLCKQFQEGVQKPLKRIKEAAAEKVKSVALLLEAEVKLQNPARDELLPSAGCPVCEARRLKQIEAQKRYRAKKAKG